MRSQNADRLASEISEWLRAYVSGAELKHDIFQLIIQFSLENDHIPYWHSILYILNLVQRQKEKEEKFCLFKFWSCREICLNKVLYPI